MTFYPLEMPAPKRPDVGVPLTEILNDGGQLFLGLGFAKSQSASNDVDDARGVGGDESANQHARAVGPEGDAGRLKSYAAHDCWMTICAPSARVSSARER